MNDTLLHINMCMLDFNLLPPMQQAPQSQLVRDVIPEYVPLTGGQRYSAIIKSNRYSFVPILKNAHSWATVLLETNLQFKLGINHTEIFPFEKFIVILRNPVERWISGAAQYLSAYDPDVCKELVSNDNFIEFLCDIGKIGDEHTNRQLDVLGHINIKQCIFFKCDSTLESTMHHFIKTISKQDSVIPSEHYNTIKEGTESKQIVYQALTEKLQNQEYLDRVKKYVLPDIKLLNYVTKNKLWYNAR
jgi:hypothetical protein